MLSRNSGRFPNMTGSWNIEISFANEQHRFLRFDAQSDGKGTLTVTDPKSKAWGGAKPSEAKWTRDEGNSVKFSGRSRVSNWQCGSQRRKVDVQRQV